MKRAVFAPPASIVHDRFQSRSHTFQESPQDLQRKPTASFTVGNFGELFVREILQTGNGAVAVDNLGYKEVNCRNWIEYPVAKAMAEFAANVGNLFGIEDLGKV